VGAAALLLLRDALAGVSPGKWFMGIAVARADDPATVPPLSARLLRNATLLLLPLEGVLVFVDPYCRRLGDRLAGTAVVARARPAPVTRRLLGLTIVFLSTMLAVFLVELWNVRRSAAYPLALRVAEEDVRVAETFGEDVTLSAPGLLRSLDGTDLHVRLEAEGSRGAGTVEVHLRLTEPPPRWEPATLEIVGPAEPEAVPAGAPPVRDAPPR
jgi:hypothetical protein